MTCQDDAGPWSHLKEAFYDTECMMVAWSGVISQYPTQLYHSVLPFLPSDTYLSRRYPTQTGGISILRGRHRTWSPLLFTLTTDSHDYETAFAPKGQMLALAYLSRIDLFDALSGLPLISIVRPEPRDSDLDFEFVCGATFNASMSEVIVARSWKSDNVEYCDVIKYNVTRQIGRVQRTAPVLTDSPPIQLSEGGSYLAFLHSEREIRIWRTDGEDEPISTRHAGRINSFSLSADSAHLVAVATDFTIVISDILSGNILQTLDSTYTWAMRISPDGSLVAASDFRTTRLWSKTRGTLLATFKNTDTWCGFVVFSHTNRLYHTPLHSKGGSVCDVSAEHDRSVIVPFPFPLTTHTITVAPNDSQIAITWDNTQVWSLKHFRDTHVDLGPHSILAIDLSSDGSLLAISDKTKIEVWDVQINRCRYIIQDETTSGDPRPIAFSPRGELIVSSSKCCIIIVIDAQTGIIRRRIYEDDDDEAEINDYGHFGISFDDCTLATSTARYPLKIQIWDLPSGAHLHTIHVDNYPPNLRWSQIDAYLMYFERDRKPIYFNAKTFQEEVLSDPGDRFQELEHLRQKGNMLHIRSPCRRKDPLFLALPSHLDIGMFRCRGDRVGILSKDGQLLLLDISGLDPYMKEFCATESGELGLDLLKLVTNNHPIDDDSDDADDTDDTDSD